MTEGRVLAPPWPALMFGVYDILYISGPAGSTVPALVALVLRGTCFSFCRDARRPRPEGRVFTVYHMA